MTMDQRGDEIRPNPIPDSPRSRGDPWLQIRPSVAGGNGFTIWSLSRLCDRNNCSLRYDVRQQKMYADITFKHGARMKFQAG